MKLRYVSDDAAYIKLMQSLRSRQGGRASAPTGGAQGKRAYEDVVKLSGAPRGRTKLSERSGAGQALFHRVVNAYLKEAYAPKTVDVDAAKARLRAYYGLTSETATPVPSSATQAGPADPADTPEEP